MKYIVLEIQTNNDGSVGTLITSHDTINSAYSKYHTILAAAAVSTLPTHSAAILNDRCQYVENEYFVHDSEEN